MSTPEVQEIKKELSKVSRDIGRVLTYLDNDSMTGRKGLFQHVGELEEGLKIVSDDFEAYKEEQQTKLLVRKAILASYGFSTGIIGYFAGFFIKVFFVWLAKLI